MTTAQQEAAMAISDAIDEIDTGTDWEISLDEDPKITTAERWSVVVLVRGTAVVRRGLFTRPQAIAVLAQFSQPCATTRRN